MRLARVLHPSCPHPLVALERDGCLYDAAELDKRFGMPLLGRASVEASDFHLRVFALRGVGLDKLDDRLLGGDRPTEARLSKSNLLWLPPCSTDRSVYVQVDDVADAPDALPRYYIGNPRTLFAHLETVPFPHGEERPEADVAIAALIGEELRASTLEEARNAVVGYSILVRWLAPNAEKRGGKTHGSDFATSLGPLLVTTDEAVSIETASVRLRVAGHVKDIAAPRQTDWSFPEMIAFISRHVPLAPGDVVGGPIIPGTRDALRELGLSFGTPLEVSVERLGKLSSRPVEGPEPPDVRAPR